MKQHYTFMITWDREEEQYRGMCSEFAHLSHFDNTHIAALAGIMDLVLNCVEDMILRGEKPPEAIADQ